ncbi:MAG: family 10 glycosylhydrolase [Clostridium sp.]
MKKSFKLLSILLVLTLVGCNARENNRKENTLDEEMRGVWIATTENLDWPKKFPDSLKDEREINKFIDNEKDLLAKKIAVVKDNNLNTIFFQVRPNGDALYYSKESPFSDLITGVLGKKANYDPLKFAVKEAHIKGLKLEAWVNPFRIKSSDELITEEYIDKYLEALPQESILKSNREWIKVYKIPSWKDKREIINQIEYLENMNSVEGTALFRLMHVEDNSELIKEGYSD